MNITKTQNGFSLNDKTYEFKKFIVLKNDAEVEVFTDTVDATTAHVGTNKGIICVTTDITLDNTVYTSIDLLIEDLTK